MKFEFGFVNAVMIIIISVASDSSIINTVVIDIIVISSFIKNISIEIKYLKIYI